MNSRVLGIILFIGSILLCLNFIYTCSLNGSKYRLSSEITKEFPHISKSLDSTEKQKSILTGKDNQEPKENRLQRNRGLTSAPNDYQRLYADFKKRGNSSESVKFQKLKDLYADKTVIIGEDTFVVLGEPRSLLKTLFSENMGTVIEIQGDYLIFLPRAGEPEVSKSLRVAIKNDSTQLLHLTGRLMIKLTEPSQREEILARYQLQQSSFVGNLLFAIPQNNEDVFVLAEKLKSDHNIGEVTLESLGERNRAK